MNSTTLRGIFPDPKPNYRKNFMRENVKLIKQMQQRHATLQEPVPVAKSRSQSQTLLIPSKYKNIPTKAATPGSKGAKKRPGSLLTQMSAQKSHNKSVQTEDDRKSPKLKSPRKSKIRAAGDAVEKLAKKINKIDLENKTEEPKLTKLKKTKEASPKSAKTVTQINRDADDKSGLVVLPDEERREYLRVARENYAALIKELNTMPIRNDTLRKRNRKIEIEAELKRLEEVIKIFQKPKVFVKAD